jgi:hypothetical protein
MEENGISGARCPGLFSKRSYFLKKAGCCVFGGHSNFPENKIPIGVSTLHR